jgi:MFS family permease
MMAGIGSLIVMPLIGRLADKIDKFRLFAIASTWMMVMVVIYTNLSVTPLWLIVLLNVLLMAGVMSRMVPSTALVSAIPEMAERGAFMSINSSLQQIAGGFAAAFAGMVVIQKDKTSPLEHYDTLGYIVVALTVLFIYMMYRVNVLAKDKLKQAKL